MKSILAGFSIGIACILYILCPNPIIGACIFGLGLLNIRLMQYNLFTGKTQRLITDTDGSFGEIVGGLIGLAFMFILNGIGIAGAVILSGWIPGVTEAAAMIASNKFALDLVRVFGQSLLCGYLMTMATRPSTPMWMTPLPVFAFVYAGLNHCVADLFYYLSSTATIGAMLPHLLTTIAGNLFGGIAGALYSPISTEETQ